MCLQVVSFVLFVFTISYPMVAVSQIDGIMGERAYWLPPLLSFVTTLTYFGFHEVTALYGAPSTALPWPSFSPSPSLSTSPSLSASASRWRASLRIHSCTRPTSCR